MNANEFYLWFKEHQRLFNKSNIEELCEIPKGSLSRNLKDEWNTFKHSEKLLKLKDVLKNIE